MQLKSFFGYAKPAFRYELLSASLPQPVAMPVPETVTLLLPRDADAPVAQNFKAGQAVKTGEKLAMDDENGPAVTSSVTGTIESVAGHIGDYGRQYTAITIKAQKSDEWDDSFARISKEPNLKTLIDYMTSAPGGGQWRTLADAGDSIHTIVIYGGDTDLLVETNLYHLKSQINALNKGIKIIKTLTGIDMAVLVVPREGFQNFDGHFEADVRAVPDAYPGTQPLMIYYQLFGRILQQGQSFTSAGAFFVRAEAVVSVGKAFENGCVPVEKAITVVDKQGKRRLISARLGTPLGAIFKTLGITVNDRDRIILGGPMTGRAVYSEQQPIMPDTDAVVVQDRDSIILTSDYPCINCGECIRICPTRVPVNMLIRFLEAGQYQEGADLYDLYSCVECGLCSFVCVSRIPILQYIKLAKFELARVTPAEEENE